MGTRSITEVRRRWNNEGPWDTCAVIYRHYDGNLDGHGAWLFEFLDGLEIVNGITCGKQMPDKHANGPGRMAAQLVSALHIDGHEPSLDPGNGPCGQEFHYLIDIEFGDDGGEVQLTVFDGPITMFGGGGEECINQIFHGTVEEFGEWLASQ